MILLCAKAPVNCLSMLTLCNISHLRQIQHPGRSNILTTCRWHTLQAFETRPGATTCRSGLSVSQEFLGWNVSFLHEKNKFLRTFLSWLIVRTSGCAWPGEARDELCGFRASLSALSQLRSYLIALLALFTAYARVEKAPDDADKDGLGKHGNCEWYVGVRWNPKKAACILPLYLICSLISSLSKRPGLANDWPWACLEGSDLCVRRIWRVQAVKQRKNQNSDCDHHTPTSLATTTNKNMRSRSIAPEMQGGKGKLNNTSRSNTEDLDSWPSTFIFSQKQLVEICVLPALYCVFLRVSCESQTPRSNCAHISWMHVLTNRQVMSLTFGWRRASMW